LAVGETVRVTIRNANKVEEIFVDGQNVETTVQEEQALAEAADGGDILATLDSTTATPRGTMVSSEGNTCADETDANTERTGAGEGGDEADGQQYDDELGQLMVESVAGKPLPMRGGNPPLFGDRLMLPAATILGSR
jgi:hypothetical protein